MSHLDAAFRVLVGGLLSTALIACSGGQDGSNEELGQGSPPVPGDTAILSTTEPAQLNDGQIAAMLAESDTAEIVPSQLAEQNAEHAEVIQFAAMMVQEHGMLSDSLRALAAAQGIVPEHGRESELLETQTRATMESLQSQSGAAFDSAYVAAMVQSHEAALNAIDGQLLPGTSNSQLRAAIEQQVRPAVAAHLEQIRQIQTTISSP